MRKKKDYTERDKVRRKGNKYYWMDRKVGEIHEDRFIAHRNYTHWFKKGNGLCFNKDLLTRLKRSKKIKLLVVLYTKKDGNKLLFKKRINGIDMSQTVKFGEFERQVLIRKSQFDEIKD